MKQSWVDGKYFRDGVGIIISAVMIFAAIYLTDQSGGGIFYKPLIKFLWTCGLILGLGSVLDALAQKVWHRHINKNVS